MDSSKRIEQKHSSAQLLPPTILFLICCLFAHPAYPADAGETNSPAARKTTTHGAVSATVAVEPPAVSLDEPVLLSVTVRAPAGVKVTLPELGDRAWGFAVNNSYSPRPVTKNGARIWERKAMLTPLVAELYRIAPMPIVYVDTNDPAGESEWFPTEPIALETRPVYSADPGDSPRSEPALIGFMPSTRTVLLYIVTALFIIGLLVAAVWAARQIRREARLKAMSPGERALERLQRLMKSKLVEKNLVKDFYVELTMIVRRYVEEQHGIRAPEQTTEEFLQSITADPEFATDVVDRLKEFMEAADLVKYAAHKPSEEMVKTSLRTAVDYIRTDTEKSNA
jgi:hypothetical protein